MKLKKREFSDAELNMYFVHDNENYYLKNNGSEDSYDVEEGIENAEIFSLEEATEVVSLNLERNFELVKVKEIVDVATFEIHEQK